MGQQTEEMHCNATNLTMHARIISSSIFKAICISHLATTQQFSSAKHTRANFNRIHFHFLCGTRKCFIKHRACRIMSDAKRGVAAYVWKFHRFHVSTFFQVLTDIVFSLAQFSLWLCVNFIANKLSAKR